MGEWGCAVFLVCNTLVAFKKKKKIRVTSISLLRTQISVDQKKKFISLSKQLWNRFPSNHARHHRQVSWGWVGGKN